MCPVKGCRAKKGHWCQHAWRGARTAGALTLRRRMSARRRRRPAARQRGGGHPPPSGGSEAKPRSQKTHQPAPRRHRGKSRMGKRSKSPPRRRPWKSRAVGQFWAAGEEWREVGSDLRFLALSSFSFVFSFVFPYGGWGPDYNRLGQSGAPGKRSYKQPPPSAEPLP